MLCGWYCVSLCYVCMWCCVVLCCVVCKMKSKDKGTVLHMRDYKNPVFVLNVTLKCWMLHFNVAVTNTSTVTYFLYTFCTHLVLQV